MTFKKFTKGERQCVYAFAKLSSFKKKFGGGRKILGSLFTIVK